MDLLLGAPRNRHLYRSEAGFFSDTNKESTLTYSLLDDHILAGSNLLQTDGERGKTHSNDRVPGMFARIRFVND